MFFVCICRTGTKALALRGFIWNEIFDADELTIQGFRSNLTLLLYQKFMFTVLPVFVKCFWNDAYYGTSIYNYINHD